MNDIHVNNIPIPFLTLKLENNDQISIKDLSLSVYSSWLHYLINYNRVVPLLDLIEKEIHVLTQLIYKIFFDSQTEFFMLKPDELIYILSYISEESLSLCFEDLKAKYKVSESQLFNTFLSKTLKVFK